MRPDSLVTCDALVKALQDSRGTDWPTVLATAIVGFGAAWLGGRMAQKAAAKGIEDQAKRERAERVAQVNASLEYALGMSKAFLRYLKDDLDTLDPISEANLSFMDRIVSHHEQSMHDADVLPDNVRGLLFQTMGNVTILINKLRVFEEWAKSCGEVPATIQLMRDTKLKHVPRYIQEILAIEESLGITDVPVAGPSRQEG
jgi:hypothetical protein